MHRRHPHSHPSPKHTALTAIPTATMPIAILVMGVLHALSLTGFVPTTGLTRVPFYYDPQGMRDYVKNEIEQAAKLFGTGTK
jgi:hypothetical protein